MISVAEAKTRILNHINPMGREDVAIGQSLGRILAIDLQAPFPYPSFDMSAMDGYAVRSADLVDFPSQLTIIGEQVAGSLDEKKLSPGTAVRIFTGARIPIGADCVVMQENCTADETRVTVEQGQTKKGQFIRPVGMDIAKGDIICRKGRLVTPRDIGVTAAMNYRKVPVMRKPRIAILSTGNELIEPGENLKPGFLVNSNAYALAAFLEMAGATAYILGIAKDDPADLTRMLRLAQGYDLLLTIGGASVGDHDLVQPTLKSLGLELEFWKIAMRPGKPLMFGLWNQMPVMGLPGNPISVMVTAVVMIAPILRRFLGITGDASPMTAELACDWPANDERQDYLRAQLTTKADGRLSVLPFQKQDSSMIGQLAKTDCLAIRPPFAPPATNGQRIEILPFFGF